MLFSAAPREKLAHRTTSQKIFNDSNCICLRRLAILLYCAQGIIEIYNSRTLHRVPSQAFSAKNHQFFRKTAFPQNHKRGSIYATLYDCNSAAHEHKGPCASNSQSSGGSSSDQARTTSAIVATSAMAPRPTSPQASRLDWGGIRIRLGA